MPNVSWLWLLIGVAIGAYLLPMITGLVKGRTGDSA